MKLTKVDAVNQSCCDQQRRCSVVCRSQLVDVDQSTDVSLPVHTRPWLYRYRTSQN